MTTPFWKAVEELSKLADNIPEERRAFSAVTRVMSEDVLPIGPRAEKPAAAKEPEPESAPGDDE